MVLAAWATVSATAALTFHTLAGLPPGSADGTGAAARFRTPLGITVDAKGNLYVADNTNSNLRKITPAGVVTTLAGQVGVNDYADGAGSAAEFAAPWGVAVDLKGNVYVADSANYVVRKVTPAGVVSTFAGRAGDNRYLDGRGAAARLGWFTTMAIDAGGNLYFADNGHHVLRKITPAGVVSTLAGLHDASGKGVLFNMPWGLVVSSTGIIYVLDDAMIYKVAKNGLVTAFAGAKYMIGSNDGKGSAARFSYAFGLAIDKHDNLYVADTANYTVRKITPAGVVTTLAGSAGKFGSVDGKGSAARFGAIQGLTADAAGNIYVTDSSHQVIRKITPSGVVTTIAGKASAGHADGATGAAQFSAPVGVVRDPAGNLFIADSSNAAVRKISLAGVVSTFAGKSGVPGSLNGVGTAARFGAVAAIAQDMAGNLYVADSLYSTIRKITPDAHVSTLAGSGGKNGWQDGVGAAARFATPIALAVGHDGSVYVADMTNSVIRKITKNGVVTTIAGQAGVQGAADGTGSEARFGLPRGIAVDAEDTVYVADSDNMTIRKITKNRVVTTLAGSPGIRGAVDGTGSSARFYFPSGLALDSAGNLLVADYQNHSIRRVTPRGVVTTLGGMSEFIGAVDGTGSAARFGNPFGICAGPGGTIFIADAGNNTIVAGATVWPTITQIAPLSIAKNGSKSASFTVSETGHAASTLKVSSQSSNSALLPASAIKLSGTAGNRTVTIKPAASHVGSATVTLTVSDGTVMASTRFLVTVK